MKQRRRIYYSSAQRSEIWDRWQAGESMSSIGRRFDRESSSVFSVISPTGGIRPPVRQRPKQALSFSEREEIFRGLRSSVDEAPYFASIKLIFDCSSISPWRS